MNRPAVALLLAGLSGSIRAGDLHKAENCVGIADDAARLACYDAAYGVARAATAAGASRPAGGDSGAPGMPGANDHVTAEFGDRGQLHKDSEARASVPKRVDFKVSGVQNLRGGLFRLTMENGQVWVTREADWALDFKIGDEVTIQRMIAGGFRVSHKGQARNVTVARIS